MTEVAKFNVGGQAYQVSRSLLEQHPQTMISKSASKQWQSDPDDEIFIERDGEMFRHVLSYLRDGKVSLPLTVTTNGFLLELEYYGVDGVDLEMIDTAGQAGERMKQYCNQIVITNKLCYSLEKEAVKLRSEAESKAKILMFAKFCIEKSMTRGTGERSWSWNLHIQGDKVPIIPNGMEGLLNEHLMQVGLKVTSYAFKSINFNPTPHYADITVTVM